MYAGGASVFDATSPSPFAALGASGGVAASPARCATRRACCTSLARVSAWPARAGARRSRHSRSVSSSTPRAPSRAFTTLKSSDRVAKRRWRCSSEFLLASPSSASVCFFVERTTEFASSTSCVARRVSAAAALATFFDSFSAESAAAWALAHIASTAAMRSLASAAVLVARASASTAACRAKRHSFAATSALRSAAAASLFAEATASAASLAATSAAVVKRATSVSARSARERSAAFSLSKDSKAIAMCCCCSA
mmetsp:Transcript_29986/g.101080  ORF Transcript_29986/g.101080 Transcript_29986/m.101080 type:complete len:255 (+) Transcript_29986:270-1034(+)